MRGAKTFFYVSLGILALAGAFHMGARSAQGQAPGNPVVGISSTGAASFAFLAVTANGDVYKSSSLGDTWILVSNVFSGAPVQATETTWGRIKAERR